MRRYLNILVIAVMSAITFSCAENKAAKEESTETNTIEKYNDPKIKEGHKSVLILSSSPRRGGNSEQLCLQFRKGAEEAAHSVEMININDYDIRYFDQKEYDRETAAADTDDAVKIIDKMKQSDVIVLSSPVYFYNMTGQLKALIDRTYGHEKDLGENFSIFLHPQTETRKLLTACLRHSTASPDAFIIPQKEE